MNKFLLLTAIVATGLLVSCTTTFKHEAYRVQDKVQDWKQAGARIFKVRVSDEFFIKMNRLNYQIEDHPIPVVLRNGMESDDPAEIKNMMIWLRWQILSRFADGRLAYAYAYHLNRYAQSAKGAFPEHNSKEVMASEAATFLQYARLSLKIDAARCNDNTAYPTVLARLESDPKLRDVIDYFNTLPISERAEHLLEAVAISKARQENYLIQAWICRSGSKAMLQAMQDSSNIKVVPSKEGTTLAEATLQVDTSQLALKYADKYEWKHRRNAIYNDAINSAKDAKNRKIEKSKNQEERQ